MISYIRLKLRERRNAQNEKKSWAKRGYASPSLPHIKRAVLQRIGIPDATWVETGTFMGDTTAILASKSSAVYTIEPDQGLFEKAKLRFANNGNIHVINSLSEEALPNLLPTLSGDINFWLDGHYSGGGTHQGPTNCPVIDELNSIEINLNRFSRVSVLVDDVRCFNPVIPEYADYPSLDFLVDWARKNNMTWHIEHDIFIAVNY